MNQSAAYQIHDPYAADVKLYRVTTTLPKCVTDREADHIETIFSELLESLATSYFRLADKSWRIEAIFDFGTYLGNKMRCFHCAFSAN